MNPETIQKLNRDVPELRDLRAFIVNEVNSLDRVSDIERGDPVVVSIEVEGRKLAREKLLKILAPLAFDFTESRVNDIMSDYAVDVE